eukprot:gene31826-41304_t
MENKLKSKPSLTLVFFGGSMLSGTSHIEFANLSKCNNYSSPFSRGSSLYSNRECAYPARFGDWLQAVYPQANVHIYNFGIGGSMSSGLLTTIVPMLDDITTTIDVVFLHYLNNDALAALHEKNGEVSIGYEDLVRHLLSIGAAVIDLPMHADYLPKSFQLVHGVMSAHQKVTSYYKVPVLSIEHNNYHFSNNAPPFPIPPPPNPLPWTESDPHCGKTRSYLPLWKYNSHPAWMYHQLVADFLRAAWQFQRNAVCATAAGSSGGGGGGGSIKKSLPAVVGIRELPPLIPSLNRTEQSAYCVSLISKCTPSSIVNASVHVAINSTSSRSNWVLGEDIKGNRKAGWWIDNPDGGNITFSIDAYELGSVVILSYLSSYTADMGRVEVYADGDTSQAETISINGRKAQRRASLFEYERLCVTGSSKASLLSCQKKNSGSSSGSDSDRKRVGVHNITVRLLPRRGDAHNKFKIMGLYSC